MPRVNGMTTKTTRLHTIAPSQRLAVVAVPSLLGQVFRMEDTRLCTRGVLSGRLYGPRGGWQLQTDAAELTTDHVCATKLTPCEGELTGGAFYRILQRYLLLKCHLCGCCLTFEYCGELRRP